MAVQSFMAGLIPNQRKLHPTFQRGRARGSPLKPIVLAVLAILLLPAASTTTSAEATVPVFLGVWERMKPDPQGPLAGVVPEPFDDPPTTYHAPAGLVQQSITGLAVTGQQKVITIAIDFSNSPGSVTQQALQDRIYSTSANSLARFYAEDSYGAISITGSIATTGTTIWMRSARSSSYYGGDGAACGTDGANVCIRELAREAVRLANPFVNFANYDLNNDGDIDHLLVIHSGGAQDQTGVATDIWSHRWVIWTPTAGHAAAPCGATVNHASGVGELVDGKCAFGYTTVGEDSPMGTIAHEFGHDLGLPDLYDTNGGSEGVGEWDVQGSGSWQGPATARGSAPAFHSVHSKIRLGWLTATTASAAGIYELFPQQSASGTRAYKISDYDASSSTYFLVEYRSTGGPCATGDYDSCLATSGFAVWHADDARYNANQASNTVNANENDKGLDLEEADGSTSKPSDLDAQTDRGDAWDLYYVGNVDGGNEGMFGPATTPSSAPKTGTATTKVTLDKFSEGWPVSPPFIPTFRLTLAQRDPCLPNGVYCV